MNKIKIQTVATTNKTYVMSSPNSTTRHFSGHNEPAFFKNKLDDNDILQMIKQIPDRELAKLVGGWLIKQPGYAMSKMQDKVLGLEYGDIIKYENI